MILIKGIYAAPVRMQFTSMFVFTQLARLRGKEAYLNRHVCVRVIKSKKTGKTWCKF